MQEYKSSEVTFKYYLPENKDDLFLHVNASKMYLLLRDIDEICRKVMKSEDKSDDGRWNLAHEIRDLIDTYIDLDEVS